jgi:Tfp pilus assembly protein FimT
MKWARGYSVVESLMVISMLGMMGLVSLPLLSRTWHEYEMSRICHEVMSNIQLAKMKSVASDVGYSFTYDTSSNQYQIQGSEPVGPDGVFHTWNDANGNGTRDTDRLYQTNRPVSYGAFSVQGVVALPNGNDVGTVPATITMKFQPDGRLDPAEVATNYRCIVIQDNSRQCGSICVENSGFIRIYTNINNHWVETK